MPTAVKSKTKKTTSTKTISQNPTKIVDKRHYFTETMDDFELPNLIEVQLNSYQWFLDKGIKELLEEVSPISDFSGKKLDLVLKKHTIDKPKYDAQLAKRKNISYEANLKVHVQLINKETGEIKEQEVFLGAIPLMTEKGTFIVNGVERVVVNQLVRSPGVFYSTNPLFPQYYNAKIL